MHRGSRLEYAAPRQIELSLLKITPLDACDRAAKLVRKAGFALVCASMKSTACYYSYPSRHGVLRIATYRKGGRNEWSKDGPTLVSVTFPDGGVNKDGHLHLTEEYIENHVANAIGLYLLRSTERTT